MSWIKRLYWRLYRRIEDKFWGVVGIIIVAVLWAIVGGIIAIPYTILAGGSWEYFASTAVFAPIVALIIFALLWWWRFAGRVMSFFMKVILCLIIGYFFLPVIFNGISILIKWMGYPVAANYVFKVRYAGFVFVPLSICAVLLVAIVFETAKNWLRKNLLPPSKPPKNSNGSSTPLRIETKTTKDETRLPKFLHLRTA